MKNKFLGTATLCVLIGSSFATCAKAATTILDKDDWKVQLYGFVEADAVNDSTRSFTEIIGNAPVSRPNSFAGDNGRTMFSGRNSRIGFAIIPPAQDDWKTKGVLEMDFLGYEPAPPTISESAFYQNPAIRIRHSYFNAEKDGWQFLAGQTWSLFGWQPTFFPTIISIAPEAGQLFQRNTQFMALKNMPFGESNNVAAALSVERPSQRDSEMPNLNVGLKYSLNSFRSGYVATYGDDKTEALSIGVSGAFKQFSTPTSTTVFDKMDHHNSSAVAVDILIPIIPSSDGKDTGNTLTLTGEFASGTGFADTLPNWNGGLSSFPTTSAGNVGDKTNLDAGQAGFDASGNFTLVKLQTWNAALQYHFWSESRMVLNLGYAEISSSNIGDLVSYSTTAAGVYDKSSTYFINLMKDVTNQIRLGLEYNKTNTRYFSDKETATNDRYQFTALFRF